MTLNTQVKRYILGGPGRARTDGQGIMSPLL